MELRSWFDRFLYYRLGILRMSLTVASKVYKPFKYPWAYKFWLTQQQVHWLPTEVPMGGDVADFNKLAPEMRSLIVNIFRMFVQADIDVHNSYHSIYARIFKPTEVSMMLTAFQNMETVHIAAYSTLLDTLGFPESEYHAFLDYEAMRKKHEWMHSFNPTNPTEVALSLAGVSGFGEGLALFASFAMLLNFPRQNLLKGMGQIISWSVRDESLHCEGIASPVPRIPRRDDDRSRMAWRERIPEIAREAVANEDAFIDLAFQAGDVPGLTAAEVKRYIRYIADIRLRQLGQAPIYGIAGQPPAVDRRSCRSASSMRTFSRRRAPNTRRRDPRATGETPSRTVAAPTQFNRSSQICVARPQNCCCSERHKQLTECMQNDTHMSRNAPLNGRAPEFYVGFRAFDFRTGRCHDRQHHFHQSGLEEAVELSGVTEAAETEGTPLNNLLGPHMVERARPRRQR
jgi:ribonucleoside-diphosphate reductase beta chain